MHDVENERERDILESIIAVRKDMLIIDKQLGAMIKSWRDDYTATREIVSQIRMIFTKDIRLVDKMDSNVFYEAKVDSGLGFRPQTLNGSNKEVTVAKGCIDRDLIGKILRGDLKNVRYAME